nr:MAG TPA: hypothetical protein [Caudoviricetes sp.]DAR06948.1 MAG TPA: hypothetical protein [Caudoviricetes sp.]DAS89833.1 MAG TPA: hypothetical protein [Caudoviricetes sp.]
MKVLSIFAALSTARPFTHLLSLFYGNSITFLKYVVNVKIFKNTLTMRYRCDIIRS